MLSDTARGSELSLSVTMASLEEASGLLTDQDNSANMWEAGNPPAPQNAKTDAAETEEESKGLFGVMRLEFPPHATSSPLRLWQMLCRQSCFNKSVLRLLLALGMRF